MCELQYAEYEHTHFKMQNMQHNMQNTPPVRAEITRYYEAVESLIIHSRVVSLGLREVVVHGACTVWRLVLRTGMN